MYLPIRQPVAYLPLRSGLFPGIIGIMLLLHEVLEARWELFDNAIDFRIR